MSFLELEGWVLRSLPELLVNQLFYSHEVWRTYWHIQQKQNGAKNFSIMANIVECTSIFANILIIFQTNLKRVTKNQVNNSLFNSM